MISGRGSNMQAIVKNCLSGNLKNICEVTEVFSNNVNAPGLKIAKDLGVPTFSIASKGKKRSNYNALLLEHLKTKNPDYIVLAGYMRVIPESIVQTFPHKIINIHPADTNLHQGLYGYDWAWENKLQKTMITVHFVDTGLDTGEIIAQQEVDLMGCESLEDVENRGLKVEHIFYSECLKKIIK
jgi:phosphoribosylglycinamide formyltransferase-1